MDAMVTARMPQGKKEAGNSVLKDLGIKPSQVINELYDYLIIHRELPFQSVHGHGDSSSQYEEALEWLKDISTQPDEHFTSLSDKEIRLERLTKKHG